MESKTLATLLIVIACIFCFPIFFGIVGGIFGLVTGVIGAVFGIIAGIIGAIFGVLGSVVGGIFGWPDCGFHFGIFNWNFFTLLALVIVVLLVTRSSGSRVKPMK